MSAQLILCRNSKALLYMQIATIRPSNIRFGYGIIKCMVQVLYHENKVIILISEHEDVYVKTPGLDYLQNFFIYL